ncbi:MAG TPA: serine hydrolase domain-containing protein [Gemmataceae bacterium]|nr:serine hydrolase domain-containing protein [Gemmataceae bacterium]
MRPKMSFAAAAVLCSGMLSAWTTAASSGRDQPDDELPITGKADPRLAAFDRLMTDFIKKNRLPGGALAVAKNGRIVYARGFGYADVDEMEPVQPDSLFRIASISKPFTAVAILQLVERGKLDLDDKVFDVLELRAPRGAKGKFDKRWKDVTILELLQHRGGWDRDKSFDPMFRSPTICKELDVDPPADQDAIICYMLRQPLDFDPGERYAYSNFGYCLLGRVVEKVSESGYEGYVKKEILAPLGIEQMRLGKTLLKDRAPGEVHYYDKGDAPAVMGPRLGKRVPEPYGAWCLEAMDSHGGWIASAPDLARFASAFNDPKTCKILSEKSIATMFARPPGAADRDEEGYYGCGWWVGSTDEGAADAWHSGSLPGTSTLLVHRRDGLTWAVLFNSRQGKGGQPANLVDPLLRDAADAVNHWPGE